MPPRLRMSGQRQPLRWWPRNWPLTCILITFKILLLINRNPTCWFRLYPCRRPIPCSITSGPISNFGLRSSYFGCGPRCISARSQNFIPSNYLLMGFRAYASLSGWRGLFDNCLTRFFNFLSRFWSGWRFLFLTLWRLLRLNHFGFSRLNFIIWTV